MTEILNINLVSFITARLLEWSPVTEQFLTKTSFFEFEISLSVLAEGESDNHQSQFCGMIFRILYLEITKFYNHYTVNRRFSYNTDKSI